MPEKLLHKLLIKTEKEAIGYEKRQIKINRRIQKTKWKYSNKKKEKRRQHIKKLKFDNGRIDDDLSADLTDISEGRPNELDVIDLDTDVCLVCGEFGKDGEISFMCVICSNWNHEECSGWDSA